MTALRAWTHGGLACRLLFDVMNTISVNFPGRHPMMLTVMVTVTVTTIIFPLRVPGSGNGKIIVSKALKDLEA
jgi:hypothetical protein